MYVNHRLCSTHIHWRLPNAKSNANICIFPSFKDDRSINNNKLKKSRKVDIRLHVE